MKVSIIGTGFIANTHVQAIRALGHEVKVIISRKEENAKKFAKQWHIPLFGIDIQLAIKNSDCIHLCTPPMLHFQHAKAAILANKHVICEKPLTIHPTESKELFELAKARKVVAAVNFNVRYHAISQRVKSLIKQPTFGTIRMIHGAYLQEFHAISDYYSWRYQGKMRAVTEIGSHWIDLVRYWTDLEITAVAAQFAHFNRQRYVTNDGRIHTENQANSKEVSVLSEDAATVFFRFSNGAIGTVVLSEIAHGKKNELTVKITGSQQALSWNNEYPYQLHIGEKNKGIRTETNPFSDGFAGTFISFFKEVYQAMEDKKSMKKATFPTFYDGYINALICEAIYQSATQNSKWVAVESIFV